MKDWHKTLLQSSQTLQDAIQLLEREALQIVMVVDSENHLLGTVTDGDIRRGLLKGFTLQHPLDEVMSRSPKTASVDDSEEQVFSLMKQKQIHQIPILDKDQRVIGLKLLDEMLKPARYDNWVVLMAGGLGTRLGILTRDCPKPLLKVGSKPLLETILDNFIDAGFYRFYISINYLGEQIREYFGDGSKKGIEIRYLQEKDPLGTAGALSLIDNPPELPMIIMNGDILTKVNFINLLNYHREHHSIATMCVREYDFQVPYGVVQIENYRIQAIEEKPVQRFFVNAGIYVLSSPALSYIPSHYFFDMPQLFQKLMHAGLETVVFPIREYWIDIGQVEDFKRANGEFHEYFSTSSI
ncbi:MAG: nucleotidyltransferase family protein [SAR324 cluster bacterium]|nr:nucleotidyltransferase family protein [SAR324 cluster bacterium]